MPFHISTKNPKRRKKALAISAAQALFRLGFKFRDFRNVEDVVSVLKGKEEVINTPYGKIKCDEIASLISKEGLDMQEVSVRLAMYESKRALRMKKIEKEMVEDLSDFVSELIDAHAVSNIDEVISKLNEVDFAPTSIYLGGSGGRFEIDKEGAIDTLRALENKEEFIELVNKKLKKKHRNLLLARKLEEYLNEIGKRFGIESTVIEFEEVDKNFFGIKVEIGDEVYLDWFEGSFEELKEALSNIVLEKELEKRKLR
ncbi:MAG: hypothetical protein ACP5KW_04700 [Thermoproteota archaeon]|jgi:hypothetical protein